MLLISPDVSNTHNAGFRVICDLSAICRPHSILVCCKSLAFSIWAIQTSFCILATPAFLLATSKSSRQMRNMAIGGSW
uniref:Uncharacterized protein n=1 Tax=Mastacembelus armatus TaxID=205130 RepID=A0A7N8XR96_9TELE